MRNVSLILPSNPRNLKIQGSMKCPENNCPPINLAMLASFLERELKGKVNVTVEDFRLEDPDRDGYLNDSLLRKHTEKVLQKTKPDIVGISCLTQNYPVAYKILTFIKNYLTDIPVIAGGVHPTFTDEECLKDGFDFVVRGEGEHTLKELVETLFFSRDDVEKIKGLSFRSKGGEITRTSKRAFIRNLDSLPIPDRDKLDLGRYNEGQTGAIITARGCPSNCHFCSCTAMAGGRYRTHSPQRVLEEMGYLLQKGIDRFAIQDDTFIAIPDRTKEICNGIIEKDWNVFFGCQSRADHLLSDSTLADLMYKAGLRKIQIGGESGNNQVLAKEGKNETCEQIKEAVQLSLRLGIETYCSFILGHPSDTLDTMMDTIRFAHELQEQGANCQLSSLVPYPGTQVRKRAQERGLDISYFQGPYREKGDAYIFNSCAVSNQNFSQNELESLYDLAINFLALKHN